MLTFVHVFESKSVVLSLFISTDMLHHLYWACFYHLTFLVDLPLMLSISKQHSSCFNHNQSQMALKRALFNELTHVTKRQHFSENRRGYVGTAAVCVNSMSERKDSCHAMLCAHIELARPP